ncbi:estradiol 17-beta-dehydrogenase 8-like [Ruditapes philippinarum]|uniref:estradiol 17-beta-dehydrogenase 8-like n=1 Tax=Ruditapes philippinarum TaxID=129788 RepID=UPI00295ABDEC|nr:estradiol 17-beta-dehydrogenase 8-like [Ruditapes philippinarum]
MAATGVLTGRVALITGAGSGIGRAVCQLFAKEGAAIAAVDLSKDAALQTIQDLPTAPALSHHAYCADVSASGSVSDLLQNVQASFNSLPTVAVNSAGITKDTMMLKMSEEQWDKVINVNLKGTFLVNQALSRALVSAGIKPASIVNISSISGKSGNRGQANYAASKAGVIGLTKTAAMELGGHGIRVNAVLPGFTITPMTDVVPDKVKQLVTAMIPLGRMGNPEEIAEACLFLASERSSYVTGCALEVTGGLFA